MMPRSRISAFLEPFAVIVCSPGPRHPSNADETGSMKDASGLAACETVLVRYLPWIPKPCHSPQRSCSASASDPKALPFNSEELFNVCLGSQSLAIHLRGAVQRLPQDMRSRPVLEVTSSSFSKDSRKCMLCNITRCTPSLATKDAQTKAVSPRES